MKRLIGWALVTAAAVAITACGGGGGGGTAASDVTLEGVAMKGPWKNARVSAYKVTTGGALESTPLVTTTTSVGGKYTLRGLPLGVVTVVRVEPIGNSTTMADEATGLDVTVPSGLSMTAAIVTASSGGNQSLTVSPLTHSSAEEARRSGGGYNSTNVNNANARLRAAFTFDPLADTPAPSTDSGSTAATDKAKQYGIVLAALSKKAKDSGGEGSDGDRIKAVVDSFVAGNLNTTTMTDLKTRIEAAVNDTGPNGLNQSGATTPTVIVSVPSAGSLTSTAGATAVETVKSFLATLRNNLQAIQSQGASEALVVTELDRFRASFDNKTAAFSQSGLEMVSTAAWGADLYRSVIFGGATFVAGNTSTIAYTRFGGTGADGAPSSFNNGGCWFYTDGNFSTFAASKAQATTLACRTFASVLSQTTPVLANNVYTYTRWRIYTLVNLFGANANGTSYTVNTKNRQRQQTCTSATGSSGSYTCADMTGTNDTVDTTPVTATFVQTLNAQSEVTGFTLIGDLAPGFDALVGAERASGQLSKGLTSGMDKYAVNLAGAYTPTANTERLAFSGSVAAMKAGVTQTAIIFKSGSFVQGTTDANGNVTDVSASFGLEIASGSGSFAGTFSFDRLVKDLSGTDSLPASFTLSGVVTATGTEVISGSFNARPDLSAFNATLPESSANFVKGVVTFIGKVEVPTRPVLNANLTVSKTVYGKTSLSGQYSQGTTVFNITGATDSTTSTSGLSDSLELASTTGAKITVIRGTLNTTITKDGAAVGTYKRGEGKVYFNDGTVQSL